jgi:hypothetical protein
MDVEDLEVYKKLCQLHIEVCDFTHTWPQEEKYELGSQARRSSNSSPAQLAEKNFMFHILFFFFLTPDTRHLKPKKP